MADDRTYKRGRKYTNDEITVYWKPDSCVHASHCYRELIDVFDPGRRPWVDMYGATTGEIIDTVNMCPTDALTWKWNDNGKNSDVDASNTNHVNYRRPELISADNDVSDINPVSVKVMSDGPLIINGSFIVRYNNNVKENTDFRVKIKSCTKLSG